MKKKNNNYVNWVVFIWVVGIFTLIFGWLITAQAALDNKVNVYSNQFLEIRTQLSEIKTNIVWIKKALNNEN